jgi:glycosyltransferase involved in cell wall biosynthesis
MSLDKACVDVVVPVFNGRDTIVRALQSVLVQEGELLARIVVVDDGSTDGTAGVVTEMGSEKIYLISTKNSGVAAARNLGIGQSSAQWVAFLDADDLWEKGKLQTQLLTASETGSEFICGSVNGKPSGPSGSISAFTLWRGNFVATSSVLVKREVLMRVTPVFSTNMTFAEDYLAWLKCLTLTRGYYVSSNLATYILSARPRYNWGQILKNLVFLNIAFSRFVWRTRCGLAKKTLLPLLLAAGSAVSIFSIAKRYLRSRHQTA